MGGGRSPLASGVSWIQKKQIAKNQIANGKATININISINGSAVHDFTLPNKAIVFIIVDC